MINAPDPEDFATNADHDGEMDLTCPATGCAGWWTVVPQNSTIRQQRELALSHIAEKHGEGPDR